MTECKVKEYYVENKQIFDLIAVSQAYFKDLFQEKIKSFIIEESNKPISLLIASYIKDIDECLICLQAGLLNAVPLLLKKIIETWRYIIYYSQNKNDSLLYYNNAKDYEKPKREYLHSKIDEIIKEYGIHILEDFEQKFYKDFLKRIYENVCSFSHQDIIELKISVLDSDSKINFFINSHKELLNDYLKTLLILVRIEFETFGYLNFVDELFISKYKTLIIELDKFNQSIQE